MGDNWEDRAERERDYAQTVKEIKEENVRHEATIGTLRARVENLEDACKVALEAIDRGGGWGTQSPMTAALEVLRSALKGAS